MVNFKNQIVLILCQIFKIILNISSKKDETTKKHPIHVYINRINNRLVVKIKGWFKIGLQMPKTMKLFGSTKKLIDKTKNEEKVPTLEVVELFLVQFNLANNQHQQNLKYYSLLLKIRLKLIC